MEERRFDTYIGIKRLWVYSMKPLGRKAYGSIPHLPGSRLGPGDHHIPEGQASICTKERRDAKDTIIVQEKMDGSCVAVALLNGEILALNRAGYLAESSPYKQHIYFASYVKEYESRFRSILEEGEWVVGEWLALAHGTRYDLTFRLQDNPFVPFDIFRNGERMLWRELKERVCLNFITPVLLGYGPPIPVDLAMQRHENTHSGAYPEDGVEGVIYRVEREGKVEFLAKWVRPDKIDGKYFPEISGKEEVWNWQPPNG